VKVADRFRRAVKCHLRRDFGAVLRVRAEKATKKGLHGTRKTPLIFALQAPSRVVLYMGLFLAASILLTPQCATAKETIVGRVEVGASGYEIPVEITNRSADVVRGITVSVVGQPEGLTGFVVDPPTVDVLEPGENQTVLVAFDVSDNAPVRPRAEIALELRVAEGFLDDPDPVVVVGVGEDPTEEPDEDAAEEPREEGAAPVLHLVRLERRGEAREHLSLGTEQQRHGFFNEAEFDEILSAEFGAAPTTIVAGEPFEFDASAMRSVRYADGSFCFLGDPQPDSNSVRASLSVGSVATERRGTVGMSNYCGNNLKSSAEWHTGSTAHSFTNVFTDETRVTVKATPTGVERTERGGELVEVKYRYTVEVSGSGELLEEPSTTDVVLIRQAYRTDEHGRAVSEIPAGSSLTAKLVAPTITSGNNIGLSLVYEPVPADAAVPPGPVSFDGPEPFPPTPGRSDGDENPSAGDDGTDDGSGDVGIDPGEGSGVVGVGEASGTEGSGIGTPSSSGAIDPTDSEIAALIAQWVAVAEPPENATAGADLRYNEWGLMVGSTPSGTITATGRPDDVGARTSPEYLWGLKDRLDSVDHCTLGEYVEGRLARSGPVGCAGRYMGEVRDLQGREASSARNAIEQLKWIPVVMRGDPAPSPDLVGHVQRQEPPPRTRQPRGRTVQLWLYDEAAPHLTTVPDLVGRSTRMARAWLEEVGLVAVVQRGSAATTTDQVGTVERQEPPSGSSLPEGGAVVLHVYGDRAAAPVVSARPSPAIDCSRWPGSVASTQPSAGEQVCDCPSGSRWNASGTGCELVDDPDQARCDRDWPGTIARRDPATGRPACVCPSGLAWDENAGGCVAAGVAGITPILPDQPQGCAHMPGTIATRDPVTGRTQCRCPVGSWDDGQRRCVTEALPPVEPAVCVQHYTDIRLAGVTGDSAAAARAEAAAREAGCNPGHIAEAVASGTSWGEISRSIGGSTGGTGSGRDADNPITPITEPAPDKHEGDASVSSRFVQICVIDVNSVLDDHYHLLVNERYVGDVANPEGGTTCYNAMLRGGTNRLELRLYATRGQSTKLKISLNNDEYSAIFVGENNHIWNVTAP